MPIFFIAWDNFDYEKTVHHQSLRKQAKHVSATNGKLCIANYMPNGGLKSSMFRPDVLLTVHDIYDGPGNRFDDISIQCQRHFVAEAIRSTHKKAVASISNSLPSHSHPSVAQFPQFPTVERLDRGKTLDFGLAPILENEGTLAGTAKVIDEIYQSQLGLNAPDDFVNNMYLAYGDQKTVSLVNSVKSYRADSRSAYGRYKWILPLPGLFHWRMNFVDMVYDVFSGPDKGFSPLTTLRHNQIYLRYKQGHNAPFHHKEKLLMRSFEARVTAMLYDRIRWYCRCDERADIDRYIAEMSPSIFMDHVEAIREMIFKVEPEPESDTDEETVDEESDEDEEAEAGERVSGMEGVDEEFVSHCRFLQVCYALRCQYNRWVCNVPVNSPRARE